MMHLCRSDYRVMQSEAANAEPCPARLADLPRFRQADHEKHYRARPAVLADPPIQLQTKKPTAPDFASRSATFPDASTR